MSAHQKLDYNSVPSSKGLMHPAKILLVVLLTGCASQGQRVYVAPSNDTITTNTEEGMGNTPVHNIYVINGSTVPIIVFGVALRDCENVKQQCEPNNTNIKIDGGARRLVLHVQPRNTQQGFSYHFSYSWRPEKPLTGLPSALPTPQ
jgi:hypothetical protein